MEIEWCDKKTGATIYRSKVCKLPFQPLVQDSKMLSSSKPETLSLVTGSSHLSGNKKTIDEKYCVYILYIATSLQIQ